MNDTKNGCCLTPDEVPRDNPPRQPALRYRLGTQPQFLRRMLDQLPRQIVPPDGDQAKDPRPLAALTTRQLDDPTIATLDAFACVCDVLSFYIERGMNEGFLRTATRPRSLVELARSIGYRPNPGVAASTLLAFALADDDSAPAFVDVAQSTQVMSVPAPGQVSQVFETDEPVRARPGWNAMRAATTRTQVIDHTTDVLYLSGVATRLKVGDPIVVLGKRRVDDGGPSINERWDLRFVTAVEADATAERTRVGLDRPLGDHDNMPDPPGLPRTYPADLEQEVLTFRERGSLFGYNAPDLRAMTADVKKAFGATGKTVWPGFKLKNDTTTGYYLDRNPPRGVIDLDREYPAIVDDAWVCLEDRTEVELYQVDAVSPTSRADFTLTAKCSRVFLDGSERLRRFHRRSTVVHLASESLGIAMSPWTDPVQGLSVELDRSVVAMPPGRVVLVRGVDTHTGEVTVERAVVKAWQASADGTRSVVVFEEALAGTYARDSVELFGNVAAATHGETVARHPLGSGDATAAHQAFGLRDGPLTFVPAATPSGGASTAEVWIDKVRWHEIDNLYGAGPKDRVYELRTQLDGRGLIQLGDGRRGARATTGIENAEVQFRKGIGLPGNLDAGQLTLLRQRPLGVQSVDNPVPATGATDPETNAEIRSAAPTTVLTMDRLVSLQDYEDFSAAFGGIGKAKAVQLWDGKRAFVHVTVAGSEGAVLDLASKTVEALRTAFVRYGDPSHVATIGAHIERRFGLSVRIQHDPDRRQEDVLADAMTALGGAFDFAAMQFGRRVAASQVVSVLHGVAGVTAVDLDTLYRVGQWPILRNTLPSASARWDGGAVLPAELLVLDPELVAVSWM